MTTLNKLSPLQRWQICQVLDQQQGQQPLLATLEDIGNKLRLSQADEDRFVTVFAGQNAVFHVDRVPEGYGLLDVPLAGAEERALKDILKGWPGFRVGDRRTWLKSILADMEVD